MFIHRKLQIDNSGICMFVLCIMDSQLRKIERLRNSVVPKKKEQQQAEIFFWKQYI